MKQFWNTRVLWTQKVWEPPLYDLKAPVCREGGRQLSAWRQDRGRRKRLMPCKQDRTGTGNPISQLPTSHCLFRTSSVSTLESVSSQFSSKMGHSFILQTHTHCLLCVRHCADTVINEAQPLSSKVGEGREEGGWEVGRKMALSLFFFFTNKAVRNTGSERLSKWARATQHERS